MIVNDRPWTPAERSQFRRLPAGVESKPPVPSGEFARLSLDLFEKIDSNRDQSLSGRELDQGLRSDRFQGRSAACLSTLRSFLGPLQQLDPVDARLTRQDLKRLLESSDAPMGSSFLRVTARQTRLEQFPGQPLSGESFDPQRLEQGYLGTCMSLATSMNLTPEKLRSMYQDHADGTVTVQFADGSRQQVEDLSQNERLLHSTTKEGERWPALLELALGQRLQQLKVGRPTSDQEPRAYLNQGQPAEVIFPLLLGYPGRTWATAGLSPEQVRGLLEASLERGAVVAGSEPALDNGIVDNHAYQVVAFDPERDRVTLANPWGNTHWNGAKDSQESGRFSMPFLHFYASFREVSSGLLQLPEHLRSPESAEEKQARQAMLELKF